LGAYLLLQPIEVVGEFDQRCIVDWRRANEDSADVGG
jgi:hypothetical protein